MRYPYEYIKCVKKRFQEELGEDFEWPTRDPNARLEQSIKNAADELLPYAANEIGVNEDELRKRFLGIRLVDEPAVNARTHFSEDKKTFKITVYVGLMMFFYKMVRLFASRVGIMDDSGPIEKPKIRMDKTVAMVKSLMAAFWKDPVDSEGILAEESIDILSLSDSQIKWSGIILSEVERFTIAHELGHVVINMRKFNHRDIPDLQIGRTFARNIPNIPDDWIEGWAEEFAADLIGLNLSLKHGKDNITRIHIYSAADWGLLQFLMLETFYEKKTHKSYLNDTHPPANYRIAGLRIEAEKSNPPQVFQLAEACEDLADKILKHL